MTKTEIDKELVAYAYENLNNLPKGPESEKMILGVPYNCWDHTTSKNIMPPDTNI